MTTKRTDEQRLGDEQRLRRFVPPQRDDGEAADSLAMRFVFVAFVFILGAVVGNCGGSMARAQGVAAGSMARAQGGAAPPLSPTLALARLCVNEAGTRAYASDDCAAIHEVIRFRARHIYRSTYVEAVHRYSRRATVDRSHFGRPWVADLWSDGPEPRGWPARARWEGRHSRWWARTYAHASALVEGRIRARCRPHTWARSDVRPADPSARVVNCGRAANIFWVVPAYARRWGGEG